MALVILAVVLLAIGIVGIPAFIYLVLLPHHTLRRAEAALPHASCIKCGKAIRGCHHFQGVPSEWVHVVTGSVRCANGTDLARHA